MRIVISGAGGLVGRHLVPHLQSRGHTVLTLVRRPARSSEEIEWDPATGRLDARALAGIEAAVNLSGAGVGDNRWTDAYKRQILDSRVDTTSTLVRALLELPEAPRVLVNASAIGAYGETGDTVVDEDSPLGDDFLAGVVREWEAAAEPAAAHGIRVTYARTGLLADPDGGAFGRLLPLFRLGVGGRLGDGRAWWSVISMPDELAALTHLVEGDLSGPVNLVCPAPAHNAIVTRALGAALHRPTLLAVPGPALKLALGEFAETVLASQRVVPQRLLDDGFTFRHPDAAAVMGWLATSD